MQNQLSHYQIEDLIGEGAFAWVYKAFDQKFERYVALKILKPFWLGDPQAIARFKQEAKIMAQLRHPNIVDVFDVGEEEGQIFLSQLLVDGQTLAQRLNQGPLEWNEVLGIAQDIASVLDYAHSEGIVHRDIKPSNILFDKKKRAYVADFGLVRAAEGSVAISTSTGGMIGTPAYMAPEQWEGKDITGATDIYALSCVVVEMLTGRVLFDGPTPAVVMRQHLMSGPELPSKWSDDVSPNISAIIYKSLAQNAEERYASAGEFVDALSASASDVVTSLPTVEQSKSTTAKSVEPKHRIKGRVLWIWGSVIIASILAILVYVFLSWNNNAGVSDDANVTSGSKTAIVAASTPQPTSNPIFTATSGPTSMLKPTSTPTSRPSATSKPTNTLTPRPASTSKPTSTPTPQLTATLRPTNTSKTPIPTHTPTSTPPEMPTQPLPTDTPLPSPPTNTPTSSNFLYSPPRLIEPKTSTSFSKGATAIFSWDWDGQLKEDEFFEVLFQANCFRSGVYEREWLGAAAPTKDKQLTIQLDLTPAIQKCGQGRWYYWTVAVIRSNPYEQLSTGGMMTTGTWTWFPGFKY